MLKHLRSLHSLPLDPVCTSRVCVFCEDDKLSHSQPSPLLSLLPRTPFSPKGCFLSDFSGLSMNIISEGLPNCPFLCGLQPPPHVFVLLILCSGLITSCNHLVYFLPPYASSPLAGSSSLLCPQVQTWCWHTGNVH